MNPNLLSPRMVRTSVLDGPASPGELATRAMIVLAAVYSVLPSLLEVLHRGRTARVGVGEQLVAQSSSGALIATAVSILLAVICSAQVITRLKIKPSEDLSRLVAYMSVWLVFIFVDVLAGISFQRQEFLFPLLGLALWLTSPPLRVFTTLAWVTISIALLSLALGFVSVGLYDNPGGVTPDKAIVGSQLLAGPYGHPNTLGAVLALGCPAIALLPRASVRWAGFVVIAVTLAWTASRTSISTVGVITVIYATIKMPPRMRRSVIRAVFILGASLVVATPLWVSDPEGFSNRGRIWLASLVSWQEDPWLGHGSSFYSVTGAYRNQLGPYAFTGHNELINLLATGGLFAVAAAGLLVYMLSRQALRLTDISIVPSMFVAGLFFESWLEARLQFGNMGQLGHVVWIPLAVVLFTRDHKSLAGDG